MSKRLVLLFCALFVFAAAMPAFAAVQNVKVSGDILARYIYRNDFDLVKGNGADGEDQIHLFNSVVRLRVDADLTDNVSAVIRLINERDWTKVVNRDSSYEHENSTDIDLDLAYVTLKEFLYSPLTLTIGRQELHFGNDMIIGDGVGSPNANAVSGGVGTNQTTNYYEAVGYNGVNGDLAYRKAFDAIRATLNYDPLVIDIVYAKIYKGEFSHIGNADNNDDVDLYGINAGYQFKDNWGTLAEGYYWGKINSNLKKTLSAVPDKVDQVHTIGARVSTNPTKKLNLQQEIAAQFGEKISPATTTGALNRERRAWAAQTIAMYTPGIKYNPTMGMIYSYFSGDANRDAAANAPALSKKYHAWDPMFENQTAGHIINALYPSSNSHNLDFMVKFNPIEDVWVQLDVVHQLMAKASSQNGQQALNDYEPSGGNYFNRKQTDIGQEVDINVVYNYTEDVQFGLLAGWFWPGKAYRATDNDGLMQKTTAVEAIASCKVSF